MKAYILAGGRGERLKPLTSFLPKPLLPVNRVPVLAYTIEWLRRQGITELTILTGYKGEMIQQYLKDGREYGVNIEYVCENVLKGTFGSIRKLAEKEEDSFLVISGDVLTNMDLAPLITSHKGNDITIAASKQCFSPHVGICVTDQQGNLIDFYEKMKTWQTDESVLVNSGMYVVSPRWLVNFPKNQFIDIARDVIPWLQHNQYNVNVYDFTGYWRDIGTKENLLLAEKEVLNGEFQILSYGNESPFSPPNTPSVVNGIRRQVVHSMRRMELRKENREEEKPYGS
ncbi:nucleotidyltransferase family protein [Mangrovibacillus cuniculi]|uniref:Nucleotidyltransferase family protein n=1 Tax=Mangrovibacillus cuniculi TaxID=2593652 RepID=A0A7S8CBF3_9BACI|nr:nucleotidyltransferase family protein [Mangrovibacillus cuniculi]QPC46878.1 nucleotidyltransferase family protein [Mangrovibacillus cuniculi]